MSVPAPNGRCRRCQRPVIVARTELRQRWFALDPRPDPEGNQVAWQDSDGTWRTRQLSPGADAPWGYERVFMPHVATCPAQQEPDKPRPLPPNVIPITQAASRRHGTQPSAKGT